LAGNLDWFLTFLRYARIISKAYAALFCVGVANKPASYYLNSIQQLEKEIEEWRLALPDNGFRPGGAVRPHAVQGLVERQAVVLVHYLYANIVLTISRAKLHSLQRLPESDHSKAREVATQSIASASRTILELTTLIEVEPYTSVWYDASPSCMESLLNDRQIAMMLTRNGRILASIPITGLFVLFDMTIHHPDRPDAATNLALLDMAAGHFSRVEYRSGSTLPGSLISEFAYIARDHVNRIQRERREDNRFPAWRHAEHKLIPQSINDDRKDSNEGTVLPTGSDMSYLEVRCFMDTGYTRTSRFKL
jgi:hypothetical protein